jgi:hypothetical protein
MKTIRAGGEMTQRKFSYRKGEKYASGNAKMQGFIKASKFPTLGKVEKIALRDNIRYCTMEIMAML